MQLWTCVTLRIERISGRGRTILKLSGRIRAEDLSELTAQLDAVGLGVVLDLGEVYLMSLEVVLFLNRCEARGIRLLNSSRFIRKWIDKERKTS